MLKIWGGVKSSLYLPRTKTISIMKLAPKKDTYFTHFESTILNSIDLEGYDTAEPNDIKDVLSEVLAIFESEYLHKNNRHIRYVDNLTSWLQGLPTVLTIPFYNYDILKNARDYGYTFESEDEEYQFIETYFKNCAMALITLDENY